MEPAQRHQPNLIGGYGGNSVTSGAVGATIGGGGEAGSTNRVTDDYGTAGGGWDNRVGDNTGTTSDAPYATVGGGRGNTASGRSATVGGGLDNTAGDWNATVGGGVTNAAGTFAATVSGGAGNTVSPPAVYATIPGGRDNTAQGAYSLAAGRRAKANHQGAFVWADSTDADFASIANDQFAVRANGGVVITGTNTSAAMLEVTNLGSDSSGVFVDSDYGVSVSSTEAGVIVSAGDLGDPGIPVTTGTSVTPGTGVVVLRSEGPAFEGWSLSDGVHINSAGGDGVYVDAAGPISTTLPITSSLSNGFEVALAQGHGLFVGETGSDGVHVRSAGRPSFAALSGDPNGVQVSGAQGSGLFVGRADLSGVDVMHAGRDGVRIGSAGEDGAGDGVRVNSSSDDGVQIGDGTNFPNYGVYIPSPGVPFSALWVQTADAGGEWALSTADKISAANVTASSLTLVALADGPDPLTPGDVVAAAGLADPLPNSRSHLPRVRLADGRTWTGVVGVVESRMVLQPASGKEDQDGNAPLELRSVPGPAKAGDYVALTVLGVANVKVDAAAGSIVAGQRLTAADQPGHVRALRSETLNGMAVTEGAPVIGIALAPLEENGTIPVLVTLR